VLRQACAGLVLAVTAGVAGRTLLGLFARTGRRRREADAAAAVPCSAGIVLAGGLETASLSLALGLVALAQAGLLLGLAGLLRPGPVLLVAVAIHLAGLPAWRSLVRALRRLAGRSANRPEGVAAPAAWLAHALWLLAGAAALLPVGLLTLYPPTAFDATLYHLPYARAFAAAGSLPFLAELRIPIFPQLMETLFAMLLPLAGDLATQAVALVATLGTAGLLWVWGRRVSAAAGWIAVAAYAGSPVVVYLAATPYVEPGLVLFSTAAFFALARWRQGGGEGWLPLAAVFGGAAADTKYLGLFVLGVALLASLAVKPPGPAVSPLMRLARVAVAGGLTIAPWYGRIVAATGNPVFPFLPEVFGSTIWNPTPFLPPLGLRARLVALALGILRLPWDVVVARARLGGNPPYSPIFLLAVPALLVGAVLRRRVRALLAVAAAYALVVLAMRPDARYLLVALPLICLATGDSLAAALDWLVENARRRPGDGRRVSATAAAILAVAIFLPGWGYAFFRLYRQGMVPLTDAGREDYLARALPAFPALRYLDSACGPTYTLYAIHAENLTYFAAGRFLGDWTGPAAYARVIPPDGNANLLFRHLRSIGVDHLLIVEGDRALPPMLTEAFAAHFRLVYSDGRARLYALRSAPGRASPCADATGAPAAQRAAAPAR
jgi:4-amino-4-deoxy-L-arabinose transferase-like glycosyltransferase